MEKEMNNQEQPEKPKRKYTWLKWFAFIFIVLSLMKFFMQGNTEAGGQSLIAAILVAVICFIVMIVKPYRKA
jgi:heme/copper-type cytochrome/quinol oxidase subunit 4